ncbi:hypothetical protein SKAU_G00079860 [Synaphobranchus kaupii]|uniref:Endonuclease/exonuclease/phosphatase domain-containing protein n=1 Tax=Synaphobranchus kaupii TaxID=118154 RepID=A0A9Q1FUF9_SYNKA|nr:hypothetical protein SKAU_G00079860 [Synaphobranchus kaupii]
MELNSEEILTPQTAEKLLEESFVDVVGKAQPNKDVAAPHASSDNENKRKQRNEVDDDINVWRCPLGCFLDELDTLLSSFPEDGTPLILLGDFNIHLDASQSAAFLPLLRSFDLTLQPRQD